MRGIFTWVKVGVQDVTVKYSVPDQNAGHFSRENVSVWLVTVSNSPFYLPPSNQNAGHFILELVSVWLAAERNSPSFSPFPPIEMRALWPRLTGSSNLLRQILPRLSEKREFSTALTGRPNCHRKDPAQHHIYSLNLAMHLSSLTLTVAKQKNVSQFHYKTNFKHSKSIIFSLLFTQLLGSRCKMGKCCQRIPHKRFSLPTVFFPRDFSEHERSNKTGPHDLHFSCSPPSHSHSGRKNARSHYHLHLDKQTPG